jgi:RNA 3'-terminal phosphate cyclase (ATP)
LPPSRSKGSAVFVRAQFERSAVGFTSLGERGRPAEQVGQEAAAQLLTFMERAGALDPYLADQLLVPAALLAAGLLPGGARGATAFSTSEITTHLTTNAQVVQRFLPVTVRIAAPGQVRVEPVGG